MYLRIAAAALVSLSVSACAEMPKLPKPNGPPIEWNTAMQSIPTPPRSGETLPPGTPWPVQSTTSEAKK